MLLDLVGNVAVASSIFPDHRGILSIGTPLSAQPHRWIQAYRDSEALWACPSGLNAMRITEANGYPLSDGIVRCRADAKRNVAVGAAMAGAGVILAFGSPLVGRRPKAVVPA